MTIFRSGFLAASIIALSSGSAFADYELNILHINDLHSRIEAINKFDSTCSDEEEGKGECFGGVARLKAAIDAQREALTGLPATSAISDALSKDLKKRGFKFVGSTIVYAHMQATGMVNDHLVSCPRHADLDR